MEIVNPDGRSHRTAFVINGEAWDTNSTYRERANRALQSFNGPNIKVDVFKAVGGKLVRCDNAGNPVVVDEAPAADSTVHAVLSAEGYDQILVSAPPA